MECQRGVLGSLEKMMVSVFAANEQVAMGGEPYQHSCPLRNDASNAALMWPLMSGSPHQAG